MWRSVAEADAEVARRHDGVAVEGDALHPARGVRQGDVTHARMGRSTHLWHLYATFGVMLAASMALIGPLPNNTLLANWFVKRRGTALGFRSSASRCRAR